MDDRIVITGTGLITSLGNDLPSTWSALLSGACGIHEIDSFDAKTFPCRKAALVKDFDTSKLSIHPRDARIMDLHAYMLIKASRDAFNHSGLHNGAVPPEETGYFAGMGMVDYNIEDLLPSVLNSLGSDDGLDLDNFFSGAYRDIHPLWPLSMLNNISFCQAAIDLNIKGENAVFSPHADSGAQSIIEALHSIDEQKSTAAIAGGVSEKVSPLSIARALVAGILNTDDGTCSPFSENRKGTILGEGCGMISLERRSSAERRGVQPLTSISGYGSTFEQDNKASCSTSDAIRRSMSDALVRANIEPSDIDLVIAHGDGTFHGDRNEADAINGLFTLNNGTVPVYSSKAALGHMLAASPAVDLILGIEMMKNGIIPATCNASPGAAESGIELLNEVPVEKTLKRILINSYGTEGQSVSLIIEHID